LPVASSEPHAPGHDGPAMLQRMELSGRPPLLIAARNGCIAPSSTLMMLGVSETVMSLTIVMAAEACLVGSAILCAVTVTVVSAGST